MEILREFVEIYIGLPCQLMNELLSYKEQKKIKRRYRPLLQHNTGAHQVILSQRKRELRDAYGVIGLTMADLYPDTLDWNFVYGRAVPDYRCCILSNARFSSQFKLAEEEATILQHKTKVHL